MIDAAMKAGVLFAWRDWPDLRHPGWGYRPAAG